MQVATKVYLTEEDHEAARDHATVGNTTIQPAAKQKQPA
jgi:hypothetical protein